MAKNSLRYHLIIEPKPCGIRSITITFPDPASHAPLYLAVAIILVALALARRTPALRRILALGSWLLLAGLIVLLLDQAAAFDPRLARIASALRIDRQEVVGRETRVAMSSDGHFWVHATINGVPRRMLVDSGATITTIDAHTAAAAGLETRKGAIPVLLRTANGTVAAASAEVDELRLGNVVARDLRVVVLPGQGNVSVIGMNLLSRLRGWRVEAHELVLTPHHPQPELVSDEAG